MSEIDSRPMVQLQSVLEPTDEIQRLKAIVQRCKAEIQRLDAEIQATLEVERYDERLRQNNDSRPVIQSPLDAYSRTLQTNTVLRFREPWDGLGETEAFISHRLWERYKNKGSVINAYELVGILRFPAAAMELWELWDHIGMIKAEASTSNQRLASARYLAGEIQKGALGYQDGRSHKLRMRRSYKYTKKQLLEIVQPECVILALAEMETPQTVRIGREWNKGQDGKQAQDEKPTQFPKNLFKRWFDQSVRKLYAAYQNSPYEPGVRRGGQRKNEDEDSNPLDSLMATTSATILTPAVNPLESLEAAIKSREAGDEVAQLIELTTPKQQELIQKIRQVLRDNPAISPRQARLEAYQELGISPDAGRQLLQRIRK